MTMDGRNQQDLDYYIFWLESPNFERDVLMIPRILSQDSDLASLPDTEQYMKSNYNSNLGEFSNPTVNLYLMFAASVSGTGTQLAGLAILNEFMDFMYQRDSMPNEGRNDINTRGTGTSDKTELAADALIAWLQAKLESIGSQVKIDSCQSINGAELNSYLKKVLGGMVKSTFPRIDLRNIMANYEN